MKRNPQATCATCPYYFRDKQEWCTRFPKYEHTSEDGWCGEHPEFFKEEGWTCGSCGNTDHPYRMGKKGGKLLCSMCFRTAGEAV